jgi:hypothetical protein
MGRESGGREWVENGLDMVCRITSSIQYMGNLHGLFNDVAQEWIIIEV